MDARIRVGFTLVTSVLAIGCVENSKPPTPSPVATNTGSKEAFLPLARGNTWTYATRVSQDAHVMCWEVRTNGSVWFGQAANREAGTFTESVTVGAAQPDGQWEVFVSSETARDGRYGMPSAKSELPTASHSGSRARVLWGTQGSDAGPLQVFETITRSSSGSQNWSYKYPIFVQPQEGKTEAVGSGNSLGGEEVMRLTVKSSYASVPVTVPAGQWSDILLVTTSFGINGPQGVDMNIFVTKSFFARGVGLVKEFQENQEGKTSYSMELTTFSLSK